MGKHRTPVVALALAGVTTSLVGGPVAGAAEAPTCQGVRATIVPDPAVNEVVGTSGRDVVAVDDGVAHRISTRGGRDLVCSGADDEVLTGRGGDEVTGEGSSVEAGPGDDAVRGHYDNVTGGAGNDAILLTGYVLGLFGEAGDDVLSS